MFIFLENCIRVGIVFMGNVVFRFLFVFFNIFYYVLEGLCLRWFRRIMGGNIGLVSDSI